MRSTMCQRTLAVVGLLRLLEEYEIMRRFLNKDDVEGLTKVSLDARRILADWLEGRVIRGEIRDINNARAFNLARARALRIGRNPPGNLAEFNRALATRPRPGLPDPAAAAARRNCRNTSPVRTGKPLVEWATISVWT
jgi:hypothetical protein